ncbi:hypothetical protein R1sor_026238 [Riccia sorocarpa]|uniref:Late embryogenesis abundant protein n=1 Tax=Riccia sorocarpa TaxID=122646 RepID=A0ABD3GAV6_9MARC
MQNSRPYGGKLHPLDAGESEPDLSDFSDVRTDAEFVDALKKGVRNRTWWKTPWVCEKEMGVFDKAAEVAIDPMDVEVQDTDQEMENLHGTDDLWDLAVPQQPGGSDSEHEDGADDCEVVGHEARHVMSEVLQEISSEGEQVKKFDPMVVYDGHTC